MIYTVVYDMMIDATHVSHVRLLALGSGFESITPYTFSLAEGFAATFWLKLSVTPIFSRHILIFFLIGFKGVSDALASSSKL